MTPAVSVFESGLRTGHGSLIDDEGRREHLPIAGWKGRPDDGDHALLDRCHGPTLDIGCGPGRMTAELERRGIPALGVDISALAVQMTVRRGGLALQRNIYDPVPGEGRWRSVLLADGNIGIGGDVVRLLIRCAELAAPDGRILVDVAPPGTGLVSRQVRLQAGGRISRRFEWSWLAVDLLQAVAAPAGLCVIGHWRVGDRWQAQLGATDDWPGPKVRP